MTISQLQNLNLPLHSKIISSDRAAKTFPQAILTMVVAAQLIAQLRLSRQKFEEYVCFARVTAS